MLEKWSKRTSFPFVQTNSICETEIIFRAAHVKRKQQYKCDYNKAPKTTHIYNNSVPVHGISSLSTEQSHTFSKDVFSENSVNKLVKEQKI